MTSVDKGQVKMMIGNYSFSDLAQATQEIKALKKNAEKEKQFFHGNIKMSEKRFQNLNIQQVYSIKQLNY